MFISALKSAKQTYKTSRKNGLSVHESLSWAWFDFSEWYSP